MLLAALSGSEEFAEYRPAAPSDPAKRAGHPEFATTFAAWTSLDWPSVPRKDRNVQDNQSKVVVAGQGYVGLPLAMRATNAGYRVVGFETDPRRVARLERGDSYIEDVPSGELSNALSTGRYLPTSDESQLEGFDIAVIAVPTPLDEGRPDLSYVASAAHTLASRLTRGAVVVLESTTYPGTTEELVARALSTGSGLVAGVDFFLGYSPERIDPGNAHFDISNTPKIVSGINAASLESVQRFYDSIVEKTVSVSRPREAEFAKLIENTFRHVNIALVNELAIFASSFGIDIWEALDAAETKPFGFMRFNPGPGVGGHCLPIDPSYLLWHARTSLGRDFRFVQLANDINSHMPEYIVDRLTAGLNRNRLSVNGSKVLLLGLAYKRNTSDLRESPALIIAKRLIDLGAEVRYVDHHVSELELIEDTGKMTRTELSEQELAEADAVIVLTDHGGIDYQLVSDHATYVLDTRHVCSGSTVEHL